ncbi:Uncharacterised protein [Vibrio cholerae]|nr:Uncharacterised protein [Vibrio cholerae]
MGKPRVKLQPPYWLRKRQEQVVMLVPTCGMPKASTLAVSK